MTTAADPLALSDADLLQQCDMERFRASGPGGQKRNKTDSAVRLRHRPTGLVGQAVESRSQHENRDRALRRLRQEIALNERSPVELEGYEPPPELRIILPGTPGNRIGPKHRDFWPGVRALLDLFVATGCSVGDTARALGLTTGAMSKLFTSEPSLHAKVNELRTARDMRPLR